MRYSGWILAPLVMLALAGCGKSNTQASSVTYKSMDWGPMGQTSTAKTSSMGPSNTSSHVGNYLAGPQAWGVRNPKPWRYIVIHHSATASGSAAVFHASHKARGWDGLGYHFVIGNGTGSGDGVVEVGYRWRDQRTGAHTGSTPGNAYNEYGIGICIVGNFSNSMPSRAQLTSLNQLVCHLQDTYNIPAHNIIGHRDAPNAATECPGTQLTRYLRGTFQPYLAKR